MSKKTIFSGIQPSGNLHLGNYLGAISQWIPMQEKYNCIFCVVDYHAITVPQDPKILKEKIIEIAKIYIASGIDPEKTIIFQQSDIKEHTELAWILNTIARMSDLFKMTQFKDKTKVDLEKTIEEIEKRIIANTETQIVSSEINKKIKELSISLSNIRKSGMGLFGYPVLMAADILLYDTDVVPVGLDQSQHVELTRTIAKRFNNKYGETFKIPELIIRKGLSDDQSGGARIMGLDDPTKKMSKSASSELNYIALTEDPKKAAKKIMRATTDSEAIVKYDEKNKPGISNLLTIYSLLADISIKELEGKYKNKGYGDFKKDLSLIVENFLTEFQKKYNKISNKEVQKIFDKSAEKLKKISIETMIKVKKRIGVK
jgi:tryptophanyl-tRNA synthetase